MSKIAIFSDAHFNNWKSHATTLPNGTNSRLQETANVVTKIFEKAIAMGCTGVAFGGDLFHVRGNLRPSIANMVSAIFATYAHNGIEIAIIPGNHDMEDYRFGATSCDFLNYIKGVTVHKAPSVEDFCGHIMFFCPYIHDSEDFKANLQEAQEGHGFEVALIHQGIDNFKMDATMPDTGISAPWLKKTAGGAWVFAGHYHVPQQNGHIVSIGSTQHQSFADCGTGGRGFWVFDGVGAEFVPIESPEFLIVEAESKRDIKSHAKNICGNHVRITTTAAKAVEGLREAALSHGALTVSVVLEKVFKPSHEKTISISTPKKMLQDYFDMLEFDEDKKTRLFELYERIV